MILQHLTTDDPMVLRLWQVGSRVSTQTSLYIGMGGFGAVPNGIVLKEEET
jgi:hypothetical protein